MIFKKSKKILSAVLSLAMIGTMFASVPLSASADDTATDTTDTSATSDIGVSYSAHVQSIGWQTAVSDGELAGTTGKAKRVEAIKVNLTGDDLPDGASITYQAHVQSYGWMTAVSDGAIAGTSGKSKRIEALKLTLSGLEGYSVEYRVHQQTYGWTDWVTTANGTDIADAVAAGVTGKSKRVEAVEIKVVKDDSTTTPDEPTEDLAVSSIAASSSKTIAVTFNRAPDDTSAITATVKLNSTSSKTVTSTWNSDNTVLTLTSSSKFASGTYTVDVMNGETDLSSSTVTYSEQKVSKIEITSTALAVTYDSPNYYGYVTYKVYDQYGADITNASLGNAITITSGVGTKSSQKNGLFIMTSGTAYSTYGSIVITAYDTSSGASTTKTLTVSTSFGTLSSMTLGSTLQDEDGATIDSFTSGTSDVAYIPFTATDVSGNSTTNYSMIMAGMIDSDSTTTSTVELTSSASTYVKAAIVKDPNDSSQAVIEVYVPDTSTTVTIDTPVTITAMTKTGSSSSMSFELVKASTLTTFTMESPDATVLSGTTSYIPFTAQDQDGDDITDGDTIYNAANSTGNDKVLTISASNGTAKIVKGADDNAYLQYVPTSGLSDATTATITATTTAGKYSSLTLTIEPAADPESVSVSSSNYVKTMSVGSVQDLGIGTSGHNGISVLNDYDETYSMVSNDCEYAVVAYTTSGNVKVNSSHKYASGSNYIELYVPSTASEGSSTVTFALVKKSDAVSSSSYSSISTVYDTTSVTFKIVDDDDVVAYGIDDIATVYAADPDTMGAIGSTTGAEWNVSSGERYAYSTSATIYGETSSGTRVLLPTTIDGKGVKSVVTNLSVSNSTDFAVRNAISYDGWNTTGVYVLGNAYTTTKTSATGTLTAVINGLDGSTHTVSTTVNSSSEEPVATSIAFGCDTTTSGASADTTIGTITLPQSVVGTNSVVHVVQNKDEIGVKYPSFYFYAPDQYGWASSPVNVVIGDTSLTYGSTILNSSDISFDSDTGKLVDVNGNAIDFSNYTGTIELTGITNNGLTSTVTIEIVSSSASDVALSTAISAANSEIATATTALAAYKTAGGLATDTDYTNVTAAITELNTAISGEDTDTITTDTESLTSLVATLVAATTTLSDTGVTVVSSIESQAGAAAVAATTGTAGVYTITLYDGAWTTGDTATIGGTVISATADLGATGMASLIAANTTLAATYTMTSAANVVTLTQITPSATAPVVSAINAAATVASNDAETFETTTTGVAATAAVAATAEAVQVTVSAATNAGTVTVYLNGTLVGTITVTASETATGVASSIAALTFPGYTATSSGAVVTLTSKTTGVVTTVPAITLS